MIIEEILKDKENKIIFLKAILLGIQYGKSDKHEIYKENIENEIITLNTKNKMDNKINNKIDHKMDNKTTSKTSENTNNLKIKTNEKEKINFIIKNLTKNIIDLENIRNNIISNITNLSYNNYNNNYSKINSLRNNLNKINNDIESKRLNLLKFIDDKNLGNVNFKSKYNKKNLIRNSNSKMSKTNIHISN